MFTLKFNKKIIKYSLIFILILFFISRLILPSSKRYLSKTLSSIVYPVLVIQAKIIKPIQNTINNKKLIKNKKNTLLSLNQEVLDLRSENIALKASQKYYSNIKEILNFKARYSLENSILSQVIFKKISNNQQVFFINKGSRDNIYENQIAVYKNNLVGKVSEVFPLYSKLTLVTDKSCKIAAYCESSKSIGIYSGLNKTNQASLDHVAKIDNIVLGDLILSSGEGLIFPQGFCLGKITSYQDNSIDYKISLEPLIDLTSLDYVLLLK